MERRATGVLFFFSTAVLAAVNTLNKLNWDDKTIRFVPYSNSKMEKTLAVDCGHPSCFQITHHLKNKNVRGLADISNRGDSSTDGVINAIQTQSTHITNSAYVTSNHFDIDSFLSVWCAIHQKRATEYESILRDAARIGDFRELELNKMFQFLALRVVCWLNSQERKLFYKPFESAISKSSGEEHGDAKFEYFLRVFESVLIDPEDPLVISQSQEEYSRVVREYFELNSDFPLVPGETPRVSTYPDIGLVVARAEEPLHYYSLFSCSRGLDVVLSQYSDNRFELETKYTTMIDLSSRPTLPRVELAALAAYLNSLEVAYRQLSPQALKCKVAVSNIAMLKAYNMIAHYGDEVITGRNEKTDSSLDPITKVSPPSSNIGDEMDTNYGSEDPDISSVCPVEWRADRITDSGPILRLDHMRRPLSKAHRYGHPFERPIFRSLIPPQEFEEVCVAYFRHAYRNVRAKMDWQWNELHEFNAAIDWSVDWAPKL